VHAATVRGSRKCLSSVLIGPSLIAHGLVHRPQLIPEVVEERCSFAVRDSQPVLEPGLGVL